MPEVWWFDVGIVCVQKLESYSWVCRWVGGHTSPSVSCGSGSEAEKEEKGISVEGRGGQGKKAGLALRLRLPERA